MSRNWRHQGRFGRRDWHKGREGDPILTPFQDDKSGVLNRAGSSKFLELVEGDWARGLVKRVDVKVTIRGTHREQDWAESLALASLEVERDVR